MSITRLFTNATGMPVTASARRFCELRKSAINEAPLNATRDTTHLMPVTKRTLTGLLRSR
jgi:hypothetical protein